MASLPPLFIQLRMMGYILYDLLSSGIKMPPSAEREDLLEFIRYFFEYATDVIQRPERVLRRLKNLRNEYDVLLFFLRYMTINCKDGELLKKLFLQLIEERERK